MKMIPEEVTLEFTQRMDEGFVLKVKELMDHVKREVESRERTVDLMLKREGVPPATPTQYRDRGWKRCSEGRHSHSTARNELHIVQQK